jgi:FkbM family methyltransferase
MSTQQFIEKRGLELAKSHYCGDESLCRIWTGHKMYVPSSDIGITPHLILDGYWESWVTAYMVDVLSKNKNPGYCLDIGANVGYYMMVMATSQNKSIYGFEPNPDLHQKIKKTIEVNGLQKRVECFNNGVSNHYVQSAKFFDPLSEGQKRILNVHLASENMPVEKEHLLFQSNLIKLDEWYKNNDLLRGNIHLIKMDIEGHEPEAIEGMEELIKTNKDLNLILEFSPHRYKDPQQFLVKLLNLFKNIIVIGENVKLEECLKKEVMLGCSGVR